MIVWRISEKNFHIAKTKDCFFKNWMCSEFNETANKLWFSTLNFQNVIRKLQMEFLQECISIYLSEYF